MLAYNFFFLPPLYTFTIADPENVVALFFFARRRGHRQQPGRAGPRPGAGRPAARPPDRRPVSVQPQAGRRGDAGRPAVGDGAPDRADAESPRRAAAARRTAPSRCAPASRRRTCWTRPTSPPPNGPGRRTMSPAADSDTLPGGKWLFQPLRTGRGPLGVVGIIRDEPGPAADARPAAAAGRAGRSGGAGDRAGQPRPRPASGAAAGGDRPAALRPADVDLARSAHAAGLDPGVGDQPAVAGCHPRRGRPRKRCWAPSSRNPIG